jgi:hypothetical protein
VQSHGPVRVGQAPVQVTLNPQPPRVGGAAPSDGGADRAAPPASRAITPAQSVEAAKLYIVIRNLQAHAQPGVLYAVFATVTTPAGLEATSRLGTINFFDAVGHDHAPGMTMQQSFVSFEVTNTLALARLPGAKLEVTIAPVGQPATNAAPVVGSISLVEKRG